MAVGQIGRISQPENSKLGVEFRSGLRGVGRKPSKRRATQMANGFTLARELRRSPVFLLALLSAWACIACRHRFARQHTGISATRSPQRRVDTSTSSERSEGSAPLIPPLSGENGGFEGVIVGDHENPEVGIFPTGERALLTLGGTITGYVERGNPPVNDAALSNGLTRHRGQAITFLFGSSPSWLVALAGSDAGSGNPGNYHAYLRRGSVWSKIDSRNPGWSSPASTAWDANSFWLFLPDPFYLINGTLLEGQYPCTGTRRLRLAHIGLDGSPKELPKVDADFFLRGLIADERGHAFVWGWSACRAGLFVGLLECSKVSLELVPGTEYCTERSENNGLPAMQAQVFAADDGGLQVLRVPSTADSKKTIGACDTLTLHHRSPSGSWSSRPLNPARGAWSTGKASSYVAPNGVVWAATERPSVLAWAPDGSVTEYPLSTSCAATQVATESGDERETVALDSDLPISRLVAASGELWAAVRYSNGMGGLCRLRHGDH